MLFMFPNSNKNYFYFNNINLVDKKKYKHISIHKIVAQSG